MNKFIEKTKHPQKYQDELLMNFIKTNCETEFGKDYNFASLKTREDFVKNFPLTTFAHYEKYVGRVADGEQNVMTKEEVIHLSITSGTTGKHKRYPLTKTFTKLIRPIMIVSVYVGSKLMARKLNRDFFFSLASPMKKSKGGIPIGSMSSAIMQRNYDDVVPLQNHKIFKEEPSYFVQAVFGTPRSRCRFLLWFFW